MPRFTVLLPTRNQADVLQYAIESVLYQSPTKPVVPPTGVRGRVAKAGKGTLLRS